MTTKEKAPTSSATLARAAGGTSGETVSSMNFTTEDRHRQGRIAALLMEGEGNALPAADLARLAGFKNERPLRAAIDRERARGALILASDNGYFWPACGDRGITELRQFIRRMDARCTANRLSTKSARAALRALEKAPLDGQASFWDGDSNG